MQKVKLWHQVLSYIVCKMLMWKGCAATEICCGSKDADAATFGGHAGCRLVLLVRMQEFQRLSRIPSLSCLYSLSVMVPVLAQSFWASLPAFSGAQAGQPFVPLTLQLGEVLPRI